MPTKPTSVKAYLDALPEDRRKIVEAVRGEINRRLPKGYEEGIQYGMIGWYVPHKVFPAGYHCDPKQPLPFAGLASQKSYVSIYLMCVYGREEHRKAFEQAWKKTGKRLDMGQACIRVKRLEDVPLEVVGDAVARVPVKEFVAHYESVLAQGGKRKQASGKTKSKPTKKKAAAKKPVARKTSAARKR